MDSKKSPTSGEVLNVLTRLMTPFRREFQQILDVNRLLVDDTYAKEILDKLQQSDNPIIVSAEQFLRDWMKIDSQVLTPRVGEASFQPDHVLSPTGVNPLAPIEATAPSTPDKPAPPSKYVTRLR